MQTAAMRAANVQFNPFAFLGSQPVPPRYHAGVTFASFRANLQRPVTDAQIGGFRDICLGKRITPDSTLVLTLWQSQGEATYDDCLALVKREGGSLLGAQGLSLATELFRGDLPEYDCFSFDETQHLFQAVGDRFVPFVDRGRRFGFADTGRIFTENDLIMVFHQYH